MHSKYNENVGKTGIRKKCVIYFYTPVHVSSIIYYVT